LVGGHPSGAEGVPANTLVPNSVEIRNQVQAPHVWDLGNFQYFLYLFFIFIYMPRKKTQLRCRWCGTTEKIEELTADMWASNLCCKVCKEKRERERKENKRKMAEEEAKIRREIEQEQQQRKKARKEDEVSFMYYL
jgi:hypothetical protein